MPKFRSALVDQAAATPRLVRWDPSSKSFSVVTVAMLLVAVSASFATSAVSLSWISRNVLDEPGWLAPFSLSLMLDAGILASTLSTAARRAVGRSARTTWALVAAFTLASMTLNIFHELSISSHVPMAGEVMRVMAAMLPPLVNLAAFESALSTILKPADGTAEQRQALARLNDAGKLAAITGSSRMAPQMKADQAEAIRAAWTATAGQASRAELARQFNVSSAVVRDALKDVVSKAGSVTATPQPRTPPTLTVPEL